MVNRVESSVFVAIATPGLQRAMAFYQALLGQTPTQHQPQQYVEFWIQGLKLALFQPKPERLAEFAPTRPGAMSLCIEVPDLVAAIALITQLGYPPPGDIITASHGREIYAYDPDGNRLILHEQAAES